MLASQAKKHNIAVAASPVPALPPSIPGAMMQPIFMPLRAPMMTQMGMPLRGMRPPPPPPPRA